MTEMLAHEVFKSETHSVVLFLALNIIYLGWYCQYIDTL